MSEKTESQPTLDPVTGERGVREHTRCASCGSSLRVFGVTPNQAAMTIVWDDAIRDHVRRHPEHRAEVVRDIVERRLSEARKRVLAWLDAPEGA